jgi:hypothetical protein
MNRTTRFSVFVLAAITISLLLPAAVGADPSGGGTAATSVAGAVHGAGDVAALAEQFGAVMDRYAREPSPDRRRKLLQEANDILARLVAQADDVEAEIAILSQKKLEKPYLDKLERVLANVQGMRRQAEARMAAAEQG